MRRGYYLHTASSPQQTAGYSRADNKFQIVSKDKPAGDQPAAIKSLVSGLEKG